MKITKETFNKLYSDDITKREYDTIIEEIDIRFSEIVLALEPRATTGSRWFAYGNVDWNSDNGDAGFFDIYEFKKEIEIACSGFSLKEPYYNTIPTCWLWEDGFKEEYDKEVAEYKKKQDKDKLKKKQKREELKERKQKFKEIIQSKLTKEELKYIQFK